MVSSASSKRPRHSASSVSTVYRGEGGWGGRIFPESSARWFDSRNAEGFSGPSNRKALARVFRARFLEALTKAGLSLPCTIPRKWVVDCTCAGIGLSALKYLSRYLYRGVIAENNIISNQDGKITFQYVESRTGKTLHRTLEGHDFVWLVLPKGFRRVRDYGFLHGNAKKLLSLVQLVLQALIQACKTRPRPAFLCPVVSFRQACRGGKFFERGQVRWTCEGAGRGGYGEESAERPRVCGCAD
jgi:hypothetical protein